MSIFEFFSRDAGRKRREYLEDVVGGAMKVLYHLIYAQRLSLFPKQIQ